MTVEDPTMCLCGHTIDRHTGSGELDLPFACEACDSCEEFVEDDNEALF